MPGLGSRQQRTNLEELKVRTTELGEHEQDLRIQSVRLELRLPSDEAQGVARGKVSDESEMSCEQPGGTESTDRLKMEWAVCRTPTLMEKLSAEMDDTSCYIRRERTRGPASATIRQDERPWAGC